MIPNIFISSTIKDLHHLRENIRRVVTDLGYNPIMSEFGDVGYSFESSVIESAYETVKDCSLVIIIIAKNYGFVTENNLSVSHNEYRAARKSNKPIICFVEEEVISFKKIFEANSEDIDVPEMKYPEKVFEFIREVSQSKINNAILQYSRSSEIEELLKRQLANWFGDFLSKKSDPVQSDIKDVLSEVISLRQHLTEGDDPIRSMRTIRILLDEDSANLKNLLEAMFDTLEEGIMNISKYDTLQMMLNDTAKSVKILNYQELASIARENMGSVLALSGWQIYHQQDENNIPGVAGYFLNSAKELLISQNAIEDMNQVFDAVKSL